MNSASEIDFEFLEFSRHKVYQKRINNGSVPKSRDLLNPPSVGPNGELHQHYFPFDTREKGNRNQGHTYGTQLSGEDKTRLLEYLKTL